MKHKFLIFSCILFLFACKKEKIDDPNFVGKWVLQKRAVENVDLDIYITPTNCLDDSVFYSTEYGNITVEIKSNGEFVFESNKGSETLKMISKEKRETKITNYTANYSYCSFPLNEEFTVSGYDVVLKNKKGRKFKFPLFYIPQVDRLVTVPWVKDHDYYAVDRVYASKYDGPFYSFNSNSSGNYNQILGKFKKQ